MNRGKLSTTFNKHIQNNIWLYIATLLTLSIGIVIGIYTVRYMGSFDKQDLVSYLNSSSDYINLGTMSHKSIFLEAIKSNVSLIVIVWFLGLTMLGMPIILIIDAIKGFTIGFSISFMINGLGLKGIWISALGILPQNIIYIPCIIVSSVLAMEFSITFLRDKIGKQYGTNMMARTASYSIVFLFVSFIMLGGLVLETYLTPNILRILVSNVGSGSI